MISTMCAMASIASSKAQTIEFPVGAVPGYFSANFGEFRTNHFHTGVDIKTDGVSGKPVLAAADGFISRIAVQPGGYGLALYIAHPDGTTSVYGHLSAFRADIEAWARSERYRLKRNAVDLYPDAGLFPVAKGDRIAASGNTGGSRGPHLHFEIRDARQRPYNLIKTGVMTTPDHIAPRIARLYYVEVDSLRGVPLHAAPRAIELVERSPGRYALRSLTPLPIGPNGYFVVDTYDRKDNMPHIYAPWRVSQTIDGEKNYELQLNRLDFSQTRYCNAVSYYPLQRRTAHTMVRLARLQATPFAFYPVLRDEGMVRPAIGQLLDIDIEVEDDSGNTSLLSFSASRQPLEEDFRASLNRGDLRLATPLRGYKDDRVNIPAGALYEPVYIEVRELPGGALRVGDPDTPLHKPFTLKLPAPATRGCLVLSRAGKLSYAGGRVENGYVIGSLSAFGDYTVARDTIEPRISVPHVTAGTITFTVSDNFSGIRRYEARLDGQWIALDRPNPWSAIVHRFDDARTPRGRTYALEIEAEDGCGNTHVFRMNIAR